MNNNPSNDAREKFLDRLPDSGVFAIMSNKGQKLAYLEGIKSDVVEAAFLMDAFQGVVPGDIVPINIVKVSEDVIKEMKTAKDAFNAAAELYKKHPLLGLGLKLLLISAVFVGCNHPSEKAVKSQVLNAILSIG